MAIRVSLMCRPHQHPGQDVRLLLDTAKAADDAGLYSIHFGDHLLLASHPERYPYGPFRHETDSAWLDPLTTMAAIAARTTRLRLSTGIVLVPLRPAALLSKTIVTIDALSGGRLEVGIGVGWQPEEYEACGIPWGERYRRLHDTVAACRQLWGPQPASYQSEFFRFDKVWSYPRPVQDPLPILYGVAMTARNAARVAELGDGWCPVAITPEELRAGVEVMNAAFRAAGRDPSKALVRMSMKHEFDSAGRIDLPRTIARAQDYVAAGASIVGIATPPEPQSMAEIYRHVDELAKLAAAA